MNPAPAAPDAASADRLQLIDAFKAIGSQLIVLHHLAFYGPMSDWTHQLAPAVVEWFSQDARMAVQVFLVVAGFLAARSLAPQGTPRAGSPAPVLLWQRYVRVALPYLAALLLTLACTELARLWMTHDSLPDPPELWQLLTHALLVHSLLDVDSLSAGVWYVAIDFQLFALLVALLWLAQRRPAGATAAGAAHALVALVVLGSLFHFNRNAGWDDWAFYFFGAYGLGVLTCWGSHPQAGAASRRVLACLYAATLLALVLDFRARIALALVVSMVLAAAQHGRWLTTWPRSRSLAYLGRISYSVFLLNFPVALVVNAWFTRHASADPVVQTLGVGLAWLTCNLAGAAFHHAVESRLSRVSRRPG